MVFSEADCGEVAIEEDGVLRIFNDYAKAIVSVDPACRLTFSAVLEGPGEEDRTFNVVLGAPLTVISLN